MIPPPEPGDGTVAPLAESSITILRLGNLWKVREQGDVRFQLKVPRLCLGVGQFVAVVGESGCGKSTLLDILAMVLKPTQCDEFWLADRNGTGAGTDIWHLWTAGEEDKLAEIRRRDLGYVLQTGGLMPFLSVEENINLPLRILGVALSTAAIRTLARRLEVHSVLSKKPQYLSGGQRQRVAILRALVHKPRIILADEPTAAVDKTRARAIVEDFKALARDRGTTVVMVTHDQSLIRDLADSTYSFEVTPRSATEICSTCYFKTA